MCANIVMSTVKEFHDQTNLKNQHLTVHLVNNDEPSVKEMERAGREILVSLYLSTEGQPVGVRENASRSRKASRNHPQN